MKLISKLLIVAGLMNRASGQNVKMEAASWDLTTQKAEFGNYEGKYAMRLSGRKQAILNNVNFTSGTIEFDVAPTDPVGNPFVSFYFRRQDTLESECVYLRLGTKFREKRNDAIQYSPFVKGAELWNMLPQFQGPADVHDSGWNHIKLVVSGFQLRAFVNDMAQPALEIPRMEGDAKAGAIAVDGVAAYANFIVTKNVEGLSAVPGTDLSNHDANYIRHWQVSQPALIDPALDLSALTLPGDSAEWTPVTAERHALIDVSRIYGVTPRMKKRYVWLKTTLRSQTEQVLTLQLGFLDDAALFINGGLLYSDKNTYFLPIRKQPDARLDILNSTIRLPLKKGDNVIMIALANYFYGWGIVARLSSVENLEFR